MKALLFICILFSLVFLYGCTTSGNTGVIIAPQPQVQINQQPITEINYTLNKSMVTGNIEIVTGNTFVLVEKVNDSYNITNCGSAAYGAELASYIKGLHISVDTLIINDTTSDYAGGCKDFILGYPNIKRVVSYGHSTYVDQVEFWVGKKIEYR